MSLIITFITFAILTLGVYTQLRVWKTRALASPGFYFSFIWGLGVAGLIVSNSLNIVLEPYPEFIDELNIFVAFTSLCFTLLASKKRKKIDNHSTISIEFLLSFNVFKVLSILYLGFAIYIYIKEGSGLDFAAARDNMHQTIENRSFLIGYFRTLSLPLSIFAGSRLVKVLSKRDKTPLFTYITLLLPFLSDTLFSFTEGGRVAMAYSMLMYIVGGCLSMPINFNYRIHRKVLINGLLFAVLISILITWVDTIRTTSSQRKDNITLIKNKLGPFSVLYGAIGYAQASYLGYQYRRVDAVEPDKLGYGMYTFNGFINWQLPFASRFGLKESSIAHAFNIYYHNQETYDYSRAYYYVTNSAYLPIIKDFGNKGAFVAIIIMVYISHSLFFRIQNRKRIRYATTFFLFYLFFDYWSRSNFYGSLSSSVLIPLYSFIIIDVVNYLYMANCKKNRAYKDSFSYNNTK